MQRRWILGAAAAAVCWLLSVGALVATSVADEELVSGWPGSDRVWWAFAAALTAQAAALLWSWTERRATFAAVVLLTVPAALLGPGPDVHLSTPAVMVATYTLAIAEPLRRTALPVALAAVVLVLADGLTAIGAGEVLDAVLVSVPQVALALGAPALVAAFVRSRRELNDALRAELAALAREREALAQAAVARERTGMARELHDIAAHHLSGIAVMAAAVERQIDSDPEAAKDSVRQVRAQSRSLLKNMRELVGLLRHDPDEIADSGSAVASLETIPALVEQAGWRTAVELSVLRPDPSRAGPEQWWEASRLGPLAQVVAYRMVQESLANATIHAPGAACSVIVDERDPATLTVTVENGRAEVGPLPSQRSGFGLLGMQERADLTGSTLGYGPTADGGWLVSLSIPREEAPRA